MSGTHCIKIVDICFVFVICYVLPTLVCIFSCAIVLLHEVFSMYSGCARGNKVFVLIAHAIVKKPLSHHKQEYLQFI